jgi:hypothetical protein
VLDAVQGVVKGAFLVRGLRLLFNYAVGGLFDYGLLHSAANQTALQDCRYTPGSRFRPGPFLLANVNTSPIATTVGGLPSMQPNRPASLCRNALARSRVQLVKMAVFYLPVLRRRSRRRGPGQPSIIAASFVSNAWTVTGGSTVLEGV